MGVEDYLESEIAVAVAATAALMSPRARRLARRGAVYGVAGAIRLADTVSSAARGAADQAQSVARGAAQQAQSATGAQEQPGPAAGATGAPRPAGTSAGEPG